MSVDEILENFFFVERGYLNGNHFVYRSPSPVLIDTGYIADLADTEKAITGLGVRLSDVSLIINTHTHCDHIGGNAAIQEQSGCEIALHRIGKHFIDTRDDWSTWWRYYNQEARFFQCTQSLETGMWFLSARTTFMSSIHRGTPPTVLCCTTVGKKFSSPRTRSGRTMWPS